MLGRGSDEVLGLEEMTLCVVPRVLAGPRTLYHGLGNQQGDERQADRPSGPRVEAVAC